ncbi:DUF29 domain-containing protein [Acidithiobacillus concretivorus]|uniref:DUF29 domain-containing protein n=1 Tax=Acidithiobacillus concretivorus TaxID=3063952 RepID=A0ABS5ZT11_9PROT|nr:DUF29 domain-containing protein [Acidithiobacillus concretivorus]MBU2739736.1 DUF29 domain-containing protein [Acidithiobacillus concretivorus]
MSTALNIDHHSPYDQDFYAWTQQQAQTLRTFRPLWMDWENTAEELESMGKRDRREVESRVGVILLHLLKWAYQPGKRTASWQSTILVQRKDLAKVLEQSPSLKSVAHGAVTSEWSDARRLAVIETGLPESAFPVTPVWDPAQVLADWWPE